MNLSVTATLVRIGVGELADLRGDGGPDDVFHLSVESAGIRVVLGVNDLDCVKIDWR
jgi:hypothetical protein